ncbi:amino acid dehydrogenase [Sulfitobacter sp. HI0082]|uniref:NAD(P)/FAD-dependent oxidoreductase n=1 Tax=uncultured Sulfitobacter sp. TaxID=191468 RepID=UPI0007CF940C|nr:amino acid dehydrogenase [Sulfitobacter sp. HI0082]MBD83230.1 FAD-dependent oxidoreductase [Sulfitobacter sp.]|tara:strand:+ start:2190 stop:3413 length:1224 start_codon:yes stop_codon:yes gene_type:complete
MSQSPVTVVGAGVVGLTTALALQARGLPVRVIDREGPAAGASAGNAGAFAFTEILPLASPRMIRQAPKWLLDPLGPLSVPPRYAAKIAPWMWRFWKASWPAQVRASTVAQTALMKLSQSALEPHLEMSGLAHMLRHDGQLQVYETETEFRASLPGWQAREEAGIAFNHLKGDEIAAYQPGLAPSFTYATFTPEWQSISDPRDYVLGMAERFRAGGGEITITRAERLVAGGVETSDGMIPGCVVLAAGAHSHHLALTAGAKIPLETERGYNTTLPAGAFDLKRQITFGGHGFVISKVGDGLRVGGAVELGGLDLPPNFARADAMLKKVKRFLPELDTSGGTQWMGFRPSLPDSLPAIGALPNRADVFCAFGHGHLGLTQSAGTAAIIANLLTGQDPSIDLTPFSPARF